MVSGVLFTAAAVGLRRVLHPGPGGTWGPLLIGATGVGLIAACFVFARRFAALSRRGWAVYSAATGVALLAILAWPSQDTVSVQLAIAVTFGLGWAAAVTARLLTELPAAPRPIDAQAADSLDADQ